MECMTSLNVTAESGMRRRFLVSKLGSFGQRNATRCGLRWVEMLKTRDQFKEATTVYFRISGEEPYINLSSLEQASYCYLFAKPPMLRKYGFHLVLSGDLYKKCDQKIMKKYNLREKVQGQHQTYALGIKEVWEIDSKVITKFTQLTPQERTKRKLESFEAVKKTFKKLNHDVNIQDFLGSRYEEKRWVPKDGKPMSPSRVIEEKGFYAMAKT
ncbi:Agamous-like MADS-box protein AGL65 [Camellia lanceoleosa]|uniref:Agamous-like MADS-box protein AGL65 n=1 Tax=Camellia lanceoleosa TaxID=1840588 RepID=A0ACC0G818_9ERIC|nr:Agamous-like MADS-box protein AGL65 [Camellia lanceoleosa]